jgi:hypothetical protein
MSSNSIDALARSPASWRRVTGIRVDRTGSLALASGIAAAINVLGLVGWLLTVRRVAPLRWAEAP